jgi:DNA-binding XRE family transcriptional regulator
MPKNAAITADAVEIIHRRYFKGRPQRLKALEEARPDDDVARKIFELRTKAGLTQAQLGNLIGTTQSVISRLESADHGGHSLVMLRRIGAALNQRVEIKFVPIRRPALQRRRIWCLLVQVCREAAQ